MPPHTWSVRDAKKRFDTLLAAARWTPQTVAMNGKATVVVIAAREYERLRRLEKLNVPSFVDHLLAMPTADVGFEQLDVRLREIEF